MLYQLYETGEALLWPWRVAAGAAAATLEMLPPVLKDSPLGRRQSAWLHLAMHTRVIHARPEFGIEAVATPSGPAAVTEEVVASTPFARLLHFAKSAPAGPRLLLLTPLSGHFATLLRDTVRTLLADHDVYLAEWLDAREVPVAAGAFGLDGYIAHVMEFLEVVGPGAHLVAICQPGPAALAATALMAEDGHPATPASLAVMASPIDVEASPNQVTRYAAETPLDWFADHVISTVPPGHPGVGRLVYPGFLQLSSFIAMNTDRHVSQHLNLYRALVGGRSEEAGAIRSFYDEYFAVLDMDAGYYLDTVDRIFQRNLLARGRLEWRGRPVRPGAISSTALLTVEGEADDICGPGQTEAAHRLVPSVPAGRKRRLLEPGVGHYGVFSGSRWRERIYPELREFIAAADRPSPG